MPNLVYQPGQSLYGWTLIRPRGKSASAEVWEASCAGVTNSVALKMFVGADPYRLRRFQREAQILADLPDPYPLRVVARYPGDRELPPAYVMPVAQPLAAMLRRERIDLVRRVGVFFEIAAWLDWLHARGIFHCDVKPGNMLRVDGRWTLADYGLAVVGDVPPPLAPNEALGSAEFCPPELRTRGVPPGIDFALCDSYSLGRSIWHAVFGQRHRGVFAVGPGIGDLAQVESMVRRMMDRTPWARVRVAEAATTLRRWLDRAAGEAAVGAAPRPSVMAG